MDNDEDDFARQLMHCEYLALSSGGHKGLMMLSVLKVIESYFNAASISTNRPPQNLSAHFPKGVIGSSIGALIAMWVACGAPVLVMIELAVRLIPIVLEDETSALNFVKDQALRKNENLYAVVTLSLETIMKVMTMKRPPLPPQTKKKKKKQKQKQQITFAELYELTKYDLNITACCVRTKSTVIFNRNDTPNVGVVDAVVASMSIPVLYPAVTIEHEQYCDGGTLMGVPIYYEKFDVSKTLLLWIKDAFPAGQFLPEDNDDDDDENKKGENEQKEETIFSALQNIPSLGVLKSTFQLLLSCESGLVERLLWPPNKSRFVVLQCNEPGYVIPKTLDVPKYIHRGEKMLLRHLKLYSNQNTCKLFDIIIKRTRYL